MMITSNDILGQEGAPALEEYKDKCSVRVTEEQSKSIQGRLPWWVDK